uniref:Uncharacterized protein n=1 Tax=Meloidogyne incognita TaxID=6306 RepID=A0A914MS27_MELIC
MKQNVEGEHCDRYRHGTIYFDNENPLGCQPCFCFGKSRENFWNIGQAGRGNFKNIKRGLDAFLQTILVTNRKIRYDSIFQQISVTVQFQSNF